VKNADSQSLKASKLAAALKQAQEYLADNSEEEFVKELKGKRTRKKDGEGEMLSAADVAEANTGQDEEVSQILRTRPLVTPMYT
jgi:hypothetical protein